MNDTVLRARPLLHYAPVPGGVYVGGPRSQLVLRGSDLLFRVADACIPRLDAGATEDELVAAVGSEKARPLVRHLTEGLRSHGMLLDPDRLTVAAPSPQVRERFAGSLAHLESVSDDPYAAFAAVRAATVALYGPPEAVRPAQRGLARAGIGTVVVVDGPDDRRLDDVDAVIWCCAGEPPHLAVPVPDRVPVVRVLLHDRVLVAGPASTGRAGHDAWQALAARALEWSGADGSEPAARPVADALAGALAARLLFATLGGVETVGTAHVVHGAALVAEEVVTATGATGVTGADPGPLTLDGVESETMPEPDDALDAAAPLSAPWTGLYARGGAEENLPQVPVALREIEYRAGASGSVFTWATDQRSATVGVALAALRHRPDGGPVAVGLTAEHWLLDGALRLLAADARPLPSATPADMGPETYRLWLSLVELHPDPVTVTLAHVPGLDWRLSTVEDGSGATLGAAWAPDADSAVRDAVSTAIAGLHVRRLRPDSVGPDLYTDALLFAGEATVGALRKQVTAIAAADGVTYRGRPRGADPVLGAPAFWSGPVEAVTHHRTGADR